MAMLEHNYPNPVQVFLIPRNLILLGLGTWISFLIVGGAQAVNDYFDYESDMINNRFDRPLVRGAFQPKTALYIGLIMIITGVFLSLVVVQDLLVFILTVALSIIAVWYNTGIKENGILGPLKKTGFLGNLVISACYTAPYVLGGLVMGFSITTGLTLCGMAITTFFGALGREIIKGIMDHEGDRRVNIPTLSVKFGNKRAAHISIFFLTLGIVSSFIPFILPHNSFRGNYVYLGGIIILDFLVIYVSYLIWHDPSVEVAKKCRKLTRTILWIGSATFLLSGIFQPLFRV